jgi:hypothetical protein
MLDEKIVEGLKAKYKLHPLLFRRSLERAKTHGELFDIVDAVPEKYPMAWCEKRNRWSVVENLYYNKEFLEELQ